MQLAISYGADNQAIRLGDVAAINELRELETLVRRDYQRTVSITGNLSEDTPYRPPPLLELIDDWYQERSQRYPGATIAFGGEAESTKKSMEDLAIAFVLAIVLIYAILAAQFKSYLQPFIIISNVIFSFTGVVIMMGAFGLISNEFPA